MDRRARMLRVERVVKEMPLSLLDTCAYRESAPIVFSLLPQGYGGPREKPIHRGQLRAEYWSAKHSVCADLEEQPQPAPLGCGVSTSSIHSNRG